ncbi:MAG: hypothetical protein COB14_09245, partial [Alphaproteobacteria bacterium]
MDNDTYLKGYLEKKYFDALEFNFKELLDSICTHVSHTAFEDHRLAKVDKEINKLDDWDGYIYFRYVLPHREEIKARKEFQKYCKKYTGALFETIVNVKTEGIGKKAALSAFCLSGYVRGYKKLENFIKKYVDYCDENECGLSAFKGHEEILEMVRSERESTNETANNSENKSNQKFITKSSNLLLNPPHYIEKRQHVESNDEDLSLNPYDHYSIPLFGREKELEILDNFLNSDDSFRILPVIGSSGCGKTRLVTQWLHEHVNNDKEEWHAGLLEDSNTSKLQEWEPLCNTLIIIDYIYRFDKAIRLIMDKAERCTEHKIRLIILDHVFPKNLQDIVDDTALNSVIPDTKSLDARKSLFYDTIYLQNVKNRINILRQIIAFVSNQQEDSAGVKEALAILQGKSKSSAAAYPLFAILIGQSLKKGDTITDWKRRDLINRYLNNDRRLPWKTDKDQDELDPNSEWVGAFIAAATVRRGLGFETLTRCLREKESLLGDDYDEIIDKCRHIVSSNSLDWLKPFEPDILGESFFLLYFRQFIEFTTNCEAFIKMLCAEEREPRTENNESDDVSGKFIEFIQRLARNLSNDDQDNPAVKKEWRTLSEFLNPKFFPQNNPLRLAVSLVIMEVSDILEEKNLTHLNALFLAKIDDKDLVAASERKAGGDDKEYQKAVYAFVKYFDRVFEADRNQQALFIVLDFYEKQNPKQSTSIEIASSIGAYHVVKLLLEKGADVNATDKNSCSALMTVSLNGYSSIASLLIENDADVDLTNQDGWSALMHASYTGHELISSLLVQKVNNVDLVNDYGMSALMFACMNGNEFIISLLIENGAKIDLVNHWGISPLMAASQNGHNSIVSLLIEKGANVNLIDLIGGSALILASEQGHKSVVSLLIEKGADVNLIDLVARSPLIRASQNGHELVVSLLIEGGAKVNLVNE